MSELVSSVKIPIQAENQVQKGVTEAGKAIEEFYKKQRQQAKEFTDLFTNIEGTQEMKKVYDELEVWADRSFKSQSASVQSLQTSLQESRLSLKHVSSLMGELDRQLGEGVIGEDAYAEAMSKLVVLHDEISKSITGYTEQLREQQDTNKIAEDSIDGLKIKLSELTTEYQKLSKEDREGSIGDKILEDMKNTGEALADARKDMNGYGEEVVETYSKIENMVTRLGASLPSLIQNPMALFSQLPSMIKNLKDAQNEYDAMTESGEESEPVWKQLIGAALNWKTALIALVPIIVKNREVIAEWVTDLVNANDAMAQHNTAVRAVEKKFIEQKDSIAKQITDLKKLALEWKDLSSEEEKQAWVTKNKTAFDQLGVAITNTTQAENIFANPSNTEAMIKALRERAKAAVAVQLAQEQYSKAVTKEWRAERREQRAARRDERNELNEERLKAQLGDKYRAPEDRFAYALDNFVRSGISRLRAGLAKNAADRKEAKGDIFEQLSKEYDDKFEKMIKDLGLDTTDQQELNNTWAAEKNALNQYVRNRLELELQLAELMKNHKTSMEDEIASAEVAAMEDGNEKTIKQIELDFNQRNAELQRQKEAYIKSVVDAEQAIFDADENEKARRDSSYIKKSFDREAASKKVGLTGFDELEDANLTDYLQKMSKFYDDLRDQYATYEQQLEAINKQYDDDIAAMKDDNGLFLAGFSEENVAEAEKQRKAALARVEQQYDETYKQIFANIGSMNKASLASTIAMTQKALSEMNPDENPERYEMYFARLKELQDAYFSYDTQGFQAGFDVIAQQITKIVNMEKVRKSLGDKNTKAYKEQSDAIAVQRDQLKQMFAATGMQTFTNGVLLAASHMRELAQYTDDVKLEQKAEAMEAIVQNINAAGEGYASSGSWIGAVIGGVSDLLSQVAASWGKADLYYARLKAQMADFEHQLELMELSIDESKFNTIFGATPIARAIEGYTKAQQALEKYQNAVTKNTDLAKYKEMEETYGMMMGKNSQAFMFIQAYEKGLTDLQAMLVKTRDRSGIAEFFGAQDEYEMLIDLAPQLWGEDGVFSVKNARAFLETNQDLEKSVRDAIQDAIDYTEAYEEGGAAMDDYLSSVFDNIAGNLTDAIWNGIENGTDAWDNFQATANSTIKNVAKQMVKEMLVTSYMKDWSEKLRGAFSSGDETQIMETFTAFLDSMETYIPAAQEQAKKLYDMVDGRYGADSADTATAKGIAQASQDSIDELNGRFSAIQTHTFTINENVRILTSNSGVILDRLNTIAEHTSNLDAMREYLNRIETSTDKMAKKGVTMLK